MTFRKCTLQKRYYLLCVLLGLAVISIFTSYQIGFETKIYSEQVQMCFSNDNIDIILEPIACYLPISTVPCNSTDSGVTSIDDIALIDDIILFEDIFEAERKPTPDRSIFFIETTCVSNGLAVLSSR